MISGLLMLSGAAIIGLRASHAHQRAKELAEVRVGDLLQISSHKLVASPAEARVQRITQGVLSPTYDVIVERMTDGSPSPDKGRTLSISPFQVLNITYEV